MARTRLTDILLSWGRVDAAKVSKAVAAHQKWGKRIGAALVDLGFCTREDIVNALAAQAGLKAVDLPKVTPEQRALSLVPDKVARRFSVVPLRMSADGASLAVAIAGPVSQDALNAVRALTGRNVVPFIADEQAIEDKLALVYAGGAPARGIDFLGERGEPEEKPDLVTVPLAACLFGV